MPVATLKKRLVELNIARPPMPEVRVEPCCDYARRLIELGGVPLEKVQAEMAHAQQWGVHDGLPDWRRLKNHMISHACVATERCAFCINYWNLEYIKTLNYQFIVRMNEKPARLPDSLPDADFFYVRDEPRREVYRGVVHHEIRCERHKHLAIEKLHGYPLFCYVYQRDDPVDYLSGSR